MFRTLMALLIALVIAVLIGAFQVLQLSWETIQTEIINSPDISDALATRGAVLFGVLLVPYSAATGATPIYSPLVALGVGGFVAGLISKSGIRMLFVSVIALVLFFLGYFVLNSLGGITDFDAMLAIARTMLIDLGVAFGLLFIPGIIGASLTAEDY
ncbi:hypothetical protein EU527_03915 [Candidatus Thorarchaeota archaeon]|nr:MAG: hypothetical protein EU527_03915 [Candidatus Thorarchaeota archaeon]